MSQPALTCCFAKKPSRVERLAKCCDVEADVLSRCFVALIALHDIGKCARGFQGKAPEFWPEYLGPKPDMELSVRHDAAGVWLLNEDERLQEIVASLLPDHLDSQRRLLV